MACDMMLSFGATTAHRQALLGINYFETGNQCMRLLSLPAALHPHDAEIQASQICLPQTRQTCAVLGVQPFDTWGLQFGCNDHRVAVGASTWRSRLPATEPGLSACDLTRLALERSHSATHAVEVLTELIARHGQRNAEETAPDTLFLIADGQEAYLLEAAGRSWALLQCADSRAVADVGMIRQDWKRLSPGLAEKVIENGQWCDDGTKLDFGSTFGPIGADQAWSLKRWSKATLALAQNQGELDAHGLRRLLADQYEFCVRRHALAPRSARHLSSLVARLDCAGAPMLWFAPRPSETPLYFPLIVGAETPVVFETHASANQPAHSSSLIERLQAQFDQDAEEYLAEAKVLHERGEIAAWRRLAQAMMQRHVEHWEAAERFRVDAPAALSPRPVRDEDELAAYAFG